MSAAMECLLDIADELPAGTSLAGGMYVIESTICSGGFGIVYRARHRSGKAFAMKEFFVEGFSVRNADMSVGSPQDYADELSELLMLFGEEGWWPGLISHPNVVRVFKYFEENDTGYIVLEHIQGTDLQDIIEHHPDWLDPDQILQIAQNLANGLEYLHANGVVHGDIAPDNIMMRSALDPVLIDFGSSLFNDDGNNDQRAPAKLRAVKDGYSAPELYNRMLHPSTSSDIYSLGATLHHMVSGVAPTPANQRLKASKSEDGMLKNVVGFPPQFLAEIRAALSLRSKERPSAKQFSLICKEAFG